jgi:hypothetical protein
VQSPRKNPRRIGWGNDGCALPLPPLQSCLSQLGRKWSEARLPEGISPRLQLWQCLPWSRPRSLSNVAVDSVTSRHHLARRSCLWTRADLSLPRWGLQRSVAVCCALRRCCAKVSALQPTCLQRTTARDGWATLFDNDSAESCSSPHHLGPPVTTATSPTPLAQLPTCQPLVNCATPAARGRSSASLAAGSGDRMPGDRHATDPLASSQHRVLQVEADEEHRQAERGWLLNGPLSTTQLHGHAACRCASLRCKHQCVKMLSASPHRGLRQGTAVHTVQLLMEASVKPKMHLGAGNTAARSVHLCKAGWPGRHNFFQASSMVD